MEDIEKYSKHDLEQLSYRILQQIAKSLSLPSNVKKMYLVQLIYAKTHQTEAELQEVILKVRHERQLLTQSSCQTKRKGKKNMRVQATEVSSTVTNTTCSSPPINLTPKQTVVKYFPRAQSPKSTSDRVLRSSSVNAYKRPNYSLLNNSIVELVRERERPPRPKENETQFSIVSHEGRVPRVNVTARCLVRRLRPPCSPRSYLRGKHLLPSVSSQMTQTQSTSAIVPAKRIRALSGIYRIPSPEKPLRTSYEYIKSIGFRRTDGKITKINALVQKPTPKIYDFDSTDSVKNVQVTIQDIINSNINSRSVTSSNGNVRPMALSDVMPTRMIRATNEVNSFSVYYHKKMRAEQMLTKRSVSCWPAPARKAVEQSPLPRINTAFSRFNDTRDVTQPIYVQVDDHEIPVTVVGEMTPVPVPRKTANEQRFATLSDVYSTLRAGDTRPHYYRPSGGHGTNQSNLQWTLESLYNLKSLNALDSEKSATKCVVNTLDNHSSETKCVYAADTTCTTVLQTPTEPPHPTPVEPGSQYAAFETTSEEVSRLCDTSYAEQDMTLRRYHEALSAESPSVKSPPSTYSSILEDALEVISQDGDYLERIYMDDRMQCILCSWAGSKIVLEKHIKDEHTSEVMLLDKKDWIVTYKLGNLVNQDLWLSHVCERDGEMYILSVKYEDPDCFMASLTRLSISTTHPKLGTITLYNKVTGEPYSWHGQIPQLPSDMPYENYAKCLRIELSKLELLPNSANIKLHNRELVLSSPSKVVVGQPELNDIHIMIFVQIHDA